MPTKKISIAVDKRQLRLARAAAKTEGLSLSAYIARALGHQLEDQRRIDAARELHASWGASTTPTAADRAAFLARMSRPRSASLEGRMKPRVMFGRIARQTWTEHGHG